MSNKSEFAAGIFPCTINSAGYGEDEKHNITVQVSVSFTDGPNKGRIGTYEDQVTNKSGPYIARSLKAIGWSGKPDAKGNLLGNLSAEVEAWKVKTGGKTTAEVKHVEIKKGKKYDEWLQAGAPDDDRPIWGKINSLGRGIPKPLAAPTAENLADANAALAAALALDSETAGGGSTPEDDIPFVTCDIAYEPNPIAKVLR